MRLKAIVLILFLMQCAVTFAAAPEHFSVEMFSPQGMVKDVRQATARFSEPMVPFGDPRLDVPFVVDCPEKGTGRWADSRNWVFDFDKNIPAGVVCEFNLKQDLKSVSGKILTGQRTFTFSTGGPALRRSYPSDGSTIDENQVFILTLDAQHSDESVLSNVFFYPEGLNEPVGVAIVKGEEREKILKARKYPDDGMYRLLIRSRQTFPANAAVKLVWGKGVSSLSGVQTSQGQVLTFKVRPQFTATFSCERTNPKAGCIPLLPMQLRFSAPVKRELIERISMKSGGKNYKPRTPAENGEENDQYQAVFEGPFPENTQFVIELPREMKDDAGRELANLSKFPLTVKTDQYPPLAKFSAPFGIIELKGDAVLPVTLRNVEPYLKSRLRKLDAKADAAATQQIKEKTGGTVEGVKGRLRKVKVGSGDGIADWMRRVAAARRTRPILKGGGVKEFELPKPAGGKAFEVIGIPLKEPGFYVVELESDILGAALLKKEKPGTAKPMYVSTAALVTNLSAHLKWGRESSLVWVTTLDKAEPVKDAEVVIKNCKGETVWKGVTNGSGIAQVKGALPEESKLPVCTDESVGEREKDSDYYRDNLTGVMHGMNSGLTVFAKSGDDITFTSSNWDEGIETWRYGFPSGSHRGYVNAHTVFDRTLLRAGETLHMKHFIRRQTMQGFRQMDRKELPQAVAIDHAGSDQRYELPLTWAQNGTAESVWKIPSDAKLGSYDVTLIKKLTEKKKQKGAAASGPDDDRAAPDGWHSGSFKVEEFRVPLMKGVIQLPKQPLINAREAEVDILLTYLSGGPAGNAPVKLRSLVQSRYVSFDDYEGFTIANGGVKEGIVRRSQDGEIFVTDESVPGEESEGQEPVAVEQPAAASAKGKAVISEYTLDKAGAARVKITGLPKVETPHTIVAELEFRDPAGEVQTVSSRIPLWPSNLLIGIKPDSWAVSKDSLKFQTLALDPAGRPLPGIKLTVKGFQKKFYSHRKRILGGFYSYDHTTETKLAGVFCEGITDGKGMLFCEAKSALSGNIILQAETKDEAGNLAAVHQEVWVAGKDEWWFDVADNDRIDLLPDKKRYEPGEKAALQVRMPFRNATVLVTVEREGVMDTYVKKITGTRPVIEIPVRNNYAPNVYVSALCVRGRVAGPVPTALFDPGKPAYKLGIAEITVGWKAHELKVSVVPEKPVYKVREKAPVRIAVKRADGSLPPKGTEVVIAAVDEGLLELMKNGSWNLLESMMGRRGHEVRTATAQAQVIGKRHYGLKALSQGGGGGKQLTRELFDTLLLWKGKVRLDEKGEAAVEIPLNDSLTSFTITAVAHGGAGMFGTGKASIRSTQDLIIYPGLPQMVREGDRFSALFTVKNASDAKLELDIDASLTAGSAVENLERRVESLAPGEAKAVRWTVTVPAGVDSLQWQLRARDRNGKAEDSVKARQRVVYAVPVRVFQSTITQVEKSFTLEIEKPRGAIDNRGGLNVSFRPKLSGGLDGVSRYMRDYPYTCMEQKVSRAIALRDSKLWERLAAELPAYLDNDGLIKYFPSQWLAGSDVLSSYVLSVSGEAGRELSQETRARIEEGLLAFVEGRITRYSAVPAADLTMRKLAALEALSRSGKADPKHLGSISIDPNLWPTSAVIDWMNILSRMASIPDRQQKMNDAEQILRSRLNFQGTTMGFSTEKSDVLWWLMVSPDVNAVRSIITLMNSVRWKDDMPRLVRGALGRQHRGAWDTTTANAWGVVALDKFSAKFEAAPVIGSTSASIEGRVKSADWKKEPSGTSLSFGWPKKRAAVSIDHHGSGKPWAELQSSAAIPLREPFSSGYRISKSLIPVDQKEKGRWSSGDVVRVRLELEAQSDMTWVAVTDPVPAGSAILGTGLGRDSQILTTGEKKTGLVWPVYEERSFEAYRAYYEYVPKGKWTVEYTVRLNNDGAFALPATRVEALYAPEMFGELPNKTIEVKQ